MKPIPLTAMKAGAALAALTLSTALTACQPQASAASTAPPTSAPTPTAQASAPASDSPGGSTGSPGGSSGGSQSDVPRGLESFYSQTIDWKDCSDGTPFKCGTATVPLDYEHPDGRTITIAMKKLPASDGNAEHGSLFTNFGGPGVSGVEVVESAASSFAEELRGAYDIIGFDPRGLGQSTPITCWTDDEINQSLTDTKNGKSSTLSEIMATEILWSKNSSAQDKIDRGAANAARCAQHSEVPELLDHVGTRNVARDLDVLRATNGDAKLNYLGISYGTYIGAVYADLFPGRVGRAVLDSAMDPSKRSSDEIRVEQAAFQEGVLRQYVEYCQAQGTCPLTGSTDEAIAQLTAFVDGLDKTPLTAPDSNATVNTQEATEIIYQHVLGQPDWEALTAMLAPAMNNRDGTLMVKAKQGSPGLSPEMTVEEAVNMANSMVLANAVVCNDNPDASGTASKWDAQTAAEKKNYPFFGGTSNAEEAYCHGWGHRAQTPPTQTHAKGSDPILAVGITGDAQTLYPWTQSLAGQLDNGHLLTVKGHGHGAFNKNTCATMAITDFLVNGIVPAEGTTCAAEPRQAAGGAEG